MNSGNMYTKLSDAIKMQIANIVYTSNPHITILFQNNLDRQIVDFLALLLHWCTVSGQKTTTSINAK